MTFFKNLSLPKVGQRLRAVITGMDKRKRRRTICGMAAGALALALGIHFLLPDGGGAAAQFTEETISRRDVQKVLSATGTLAPLNQYNVTTLSKGEVLECTFEEGDAVEKDQLLYRIDSSDAEQNIEKNRLSFEQSQLSYSSQQENLNDLSVKTTDSGVLAEVYVAKGDEVQAGAKIALLRDSDTLTLKLPFNASDAERFYVGQSATVTIDGSFETLTGHITEIDGASTVLTGYQTVKNVTIAVTNPGALSPLSSGTAVIGGIACNNGAAFAYNAETTITSKVSGTVTALRASAGNRVSAGDTIVTLSSTSVENQSKNAALSLKNSELSLQNAVDSLEDYNVTAPISGTVVTKNVQAGDSIDSSSGITALAVIYDLSALTFDIALDELDISLISAGQEVEITADAVAGETFTGHITNVSVAGTTSNGATTYPVTVQVDNPPESLLPGMNVDASIIVEEAKNALAVPVAAVQRGNTVFVKTNGKPAPAASASSSANGEKRKKLTVPDGYQAVSVETGISNDDYIEIKSGLSEGDTVYVPQVTRESSDDSSKQMQFGGMGGDMPGGGGMPPSGRGGGTPSGGGGAPSGRGGNR